MMQKKRRNILKKLFAFLLNKLTLNLSVNICSTTGKLFNLLKFPLNIH